MTDSPKKGHPITRILLYLAFVAPTPVFARSEPAIPPPTPASRVVYDSPRPTVVPEAQLLQQDELAALSTRNEEPGPEVRGGALSNEHLTYIVIALAAIVLVLILK